MAPAVKVRMVVSNYENYENERNIAQNVLNHMYVLT